MMGAGTYPDDVYCSDSDVCAGPDHTGTAIILTTGSAVSITGFFSVKRASMEIYGVRLDGNNRYSNGAKILHSGGRTAGATVISGAELTFDGDLSAYFFVDQARLIFSGPTVVVGAPTWGVGLVQAIRNAVVVAAGASMSGAASGPRYNVTSNAVIDTNSGGANFFPGSTPGFAADGGLYI
jgi:hypothetical protein